MESLRIIYFINTLTAGGKERRLVELMKGVNQIPYIRFELVVMSEDIHYKEVYGLDVKVHKLIRKKKKDLSIFQKFYNICKEFRPHIIHCCDKMTAFYAIPTCKLLNIKLVNALVVNAPSKTNILNKNWLLAKMTFPFSEIIVGNSKAGLEAYKAPKHKSILIHNGFNFQRTKNTIEKNIVRKNLQADNKFVIGMVASFSANKDYKTYFLAAQRLLSQRDDVIFLAIGKETDSIACKSLIDKKYFNHFRLLGKKSDIESYINAMDICVLATYTEGISNSIVEYMALGKPVVATRGGGTSEIVEDKKTGFLINPSKPEELLNKIEILLNDPSLAENYGLAGKLRIHEMFSIEKMVSAYITTYKKIGFETV